MTFADFNIVMRGHAERIRMEKENLITQAWYTAVFSGQEKLKDLDYYLKSFREPTFNDKPVNVEESLRISAEIERLKGGDTDEGLES